MATFHKGQRVRVVRVDPPMNLSQVLIGLEGVIASYGGGTRYEYTVRFDRPVQYGGLEWDALHFDAHHLAPLTDPQADAFLERLKKLGKEPVIPVHTVPFGD